MERAVYKGVFRSFVQFCTVSHGRLIQPGSDILWSAGLTELNHGFEIRIGIVILKM